MPTEAWEAEAEAELSAAAADKEAREIAFMKAQERVTLRDVQPGDAAVLLAWRNKPEVARFQYTNHEISEAENAAWWPRALTDRRRHYWIIEADGQDVGLANLYDIDERNLRCGWAFYIGEDAARGKGVGSATERLILHHVFEECRFHKLTCEVMDFNEVAIRLHRKFGFTLEGTLRQHVRKDGRYVDVLLFGMLREDYLHSLLMS